MDFLLAHKLALKWRGPFQSLTSQRPTFFSKGFFLGGSFLLTARSFLLTVGLCYLRWSFLLAVEIRFGLFYLRLKFGLVFLAYGGKSVWSFLLTVPPVQKIGFGLFCLRFPHCK